MGGFPTFFAWAGQMAIIQRTVTPGFFSVEEVTSIHVKNAANRE
jgi:hypothetical protein